MTATNSLNRREFLRLGGTLAAAGALVSAGCQPAQEATVPFHDMPESLVDGVGKARFFATVLDGSPVVVRTREGRPILVAPDPRSVSGRGLTVRHHAALMDLYDPDRATGPLSVRRGKGNPVASSWAVVGAEVVARLGKDKPPAVLLTGPIASPSILAAIAELAAATGLRHVTYAPVESDAAAVAWRLGLGTAVPPRPRLDRADLVVGFGAEFLDRPADGLERDFALRRSPDAGEGGAPMSRFLQFEGRLTLTGANADKRVRVRDSQLAAVASAVAHELVIGQKIGPLAADSEVLAALAPFTPEAVAATSGLDAELIRGTAAQLARARGKALVLAGGSASTSVQGPALEMAALILNLSVDAFETGLFDDAGAEPLAFGGTEALARLADELRAGKVDTLLVAGVNPVYDAPSSVAFADAMARAQLVVSLNDRLDETSLVADYLAPASHALECWADALLPRGLVAIQQPVIQPLYDTHGLLDALVAWGAAAGVGGPLAAAAALTLPAPAPAGAAPAALPVSNTSGAYHYVRGTWARAVVGLDVATPAFAAAWNEALRAGGWQGPVLDTEGRDPRAGARGDTGPAGSRKLAPGAAALLGDLPPAPTGLELQLYPHLALHDGRAANNGWLHEFPDPVTRISWGNAVSIAPRRFDALGLANGDLVEVDAGHATLTLPAYRHAGMHHDQVAIPLGFGRAACGVIGSGVGASAFPLRVLSGGRVLGAGLPAAIRRASGNQTLAFAQGSDVIDRDRRPLVPTTTLTAYEANPRSGTEQRAGGPSMWPEHEYPTARWGMAIDLSKCNGCGKCTIACQGENNIPVVGHQGIVDGREMSWMRIDRYYDAPKKDGRWDAEVWDGPLEVVEEPSTLFEPMLCQHCGRAPCETVCPFVATMHSEDGLNQQIYNRCVGTRYCANNCPFKVRRFNWWEYSNAKDNALFTALEPRMKRLAELNTRGRVQMKNNPEVTVRARGVMEKCSFCVQRIREARAEATRKGLKKDHFADGVVVPACMEACPTGAITFGDLNAAESRVRSLAEHPRAMRLLEELGVQSSISYLTKVRNDKA